MEPQTSVLPRALWNLKAGPAYVPTYIHLHTHHTYITKLVNSYLNIFSTVIHYNTPYYLIVLQGITSIPNTLSKTSVYYNSTARSSKNDCNYIL